MTLAGRPIDDAFLQHVFDGVGIGTIGLGEQPIGGVLVAAALGLQRLLREPACLLCVPPNLPRTCPQPCPCSFAPVAS